MMRGERTAQPDMRSWEAWTKTHQPFELSWWQDALNRGHCNDAVHEEMWAPVREFIQPRGRVLDIGSGPRPPFVPCTVIDPLVLEYRKITPDAWWVDVAVYAQPAEIFVLPLQGSFDTVVCWNTIDHTIGWRDILKNMIRYGAKDAIYAIATDFHAPFIGHPGFERDAFLSEIHKLFRVAKTREPFGRDMAMTMVKA